MRSGSSARSLRHESSEVVPLSSRVPPIRREEKHCRRASKAPNNGPCRALCPRPSLRSSILIDESATLSSLLRFADGIDRISGAVAGIVKWALLANALLIAGNAFSRKLFSVAALTIYDLQWHFFAAVVLLMAAYTLRRDEHVRVDLLAHRLGERGMAWLDLGGILLVLLPLCLLMVWVTVPPFLHAIVAGETRASRESLSDLPAWIIKSFIPAGFLLLGLQGIAEAIRCAACLTGLIRRPVHRRGLIDGAGHD